MQYLIEDSDTVYVFNIVDRLTLNDLISLGTNISNLTCITLK